MKYLKKVFVGSLLSLVAVFGLGFQAPNVSASGNESANSIVDKSANVYIPEIQTPEEQRMAEIDAKYEVGEELSEEDAEFVKKQAKEKEEKEADFQAMAQNTFTGSGKNSGNTVKSTTLGQISDSLGYWNHKYTLSMTTKTTKGKATKIQNKYTYSAYGAGLNGGLAKVYSKSDSSSCESQSCYSYFSEKYSGLVVYSVANVTAKITYSGGTFSYTVSAI